MNLAFLTTVANWLVESGDKSFAHFYAEELRSDLFAGLLTVAAFLFSVKTFLLVTLEKEVYSTPRYGERITKLKTINKSLSRYSQLRKLNSRLYWATTIAFVAAIMQFSLGLVDVNASALLCVVAAVLSVGVVGNTIWLQRDAMRDWLEFLEESELAEKEKLADEPPA